MSSSHRSLLNNSHRSFSSTNSTTNSSTHSSTSRGPDLTSGEWGYYWFLISVAGLCAMPFILVCLADSFNYLYYGTTNLNIIYPKSTMTSEQLSAIGEFKYEELAVRNKRLLIESGYQRSIPSECSICQIEFEANDACREMPSPCSHIFHQKCIDHWFEKSNKCPLCSNSIPIILTELMQMQQNFKRV